MFNKEMPNQNRKDEKFKEYREETKINGIKMVVWFDDGYQKYVLLFPEMDTEKDEDISDNLFIIDENPENAKRVYDHAAKLAEEKTNVYDLYKKAEEFTINTRESDWQ